MEELNHVVFRFWGKQEDDPIMQNDNKYSSAPYLKKLNNHFKELIPEINKSGGYLGVLESKDGVFSKPLPMMFSEELRYKIEELNKTF